MSEPTTEQLEELIVDLCAGVCLSAPEIKRAYQCSDARAKEAEKILQIVFKNVRERQGG